MYMTESSIHAQQFSHKSFIKNSTYLSLNPQTSSISIARSALVACVTHFSTTFEANLCCDKARTLPLTAPISSDLSSGLPCSKINKPPNNF